MKARQIRKLQVINCLFIAAGQNPPDYSIRKLAAIGREIGSWEWNNNSGVVQMCSRKDWLKRRA